MIRKKRRKKQKNIKGKENGRNLKKRQFLEQCIQELKNRLLIKEAKRLICDLNFINKKDLKKFYLFNT